MMTTHQMSTSFTESGTVWSPSPYGPARRTIQADEYVVLFETLYDDRWQSDVGSGFFFYNHVTNFLKARNPDILGIAPYSFDMQKIIRPDLPIHLLRAADINWIEIRSEQDVKSILGESFSETVDCHKIYLLPLGPKGGLRKKDATIIEGQNGGLLTFGQILESAARLQNRANPHGKNLHWPHDAPNSTHTSPKEGIGIFRIGIQSKIPAYFISTFTKQDNEAYTHAGKSHDWGAQNQTHDARPNPCQIYATPSASLFDIHFFPGLVTPGKSKCSVLKLGSTEVLACVEIVSDIARFDMSGMDQGLYSLRIDINGHTMLRCPFVYRDDYIYPKVADTDISIRQTP